MDDERTAYVLGFAYPVNIDTSQGLLIREIRIYSEEQPTGDLRGHWLCFKQFTAPSYQQAHDEALAWLKAQLPYYPHFKHLAHRVLNEKRPTGKSVVVGTVVPLRKR